MDSEIIARLMVGVKRARAAADAALRAAREPIFALKPSVMRELEPYAIAGSTPESVMLWAAACTGVFGVLRPSELLGSWQHRDRALTAVQVRFFLRKGSPLVAGMLPAGADTDRFALPDRFEILLGATKTEQFGARTARIVAAPIAVRALWRWIHLRRDRGADRPLLFCLPGAPPLTVKALIAWLQARMAEAGLGTPRLTGKSFRRGGASGLVANGAERADAAAVAGWRTLAMLDTYADAEAKAERVAEASQRMGGAP